MADDQFHPAPASLERGRLRKAPENFIDRAGVGDRRGEDHDRQRDRAEAAGPRAGVHEVLLVWKDVGRFCAARAGSVRLE